MKKIAVILLFVPLIAFSQRDWSAMKVATTQVAPGVYRLFVGEGVATVLFVGEQGVMLIDAAYAQTTGQLKAAIGAITAQPVNYLVNTHHHADHTGGNFEMGNASTIIAHQFVKDFLSREQQIGDRVISPLPFEARPKISFTDELYLDLNGQTLQLKHLPKGHTGGDIIIYLPESKVLILGDLLFADNFPFVDVTNGGDPKGFYNNLKWIIENYPADVTLIGGHGPVYTMNQLRDYHKTLGLTMEAVRKAKLDGLTTAQMKEKRILKQWENWGKFFITEDRWIDTLYPIF